MRRQDKQPRTLAQQLAGRTEVVCDLCGDATAEPTIRGRWQTCPGCTRKLMALDAKRNKDAA